MTATTAIIRRLTLPLPLLHMLQRTIVIIIIILILAAAAAAAVVVVVVAAAVVVVVVVTLAHFLFQRLKPRCLMQRYPGKLIPMTSSIISSDLSIIKVTWLYNPSSISLLLLNVIQLKYKVITFMCNVYIHLLKV